MGLHYTFDEPLDVSNLLHSLAADIESYPTIFPFNIAVGALREAANKIEKAVYDASKRSGNKRGNARIDLDPAAD